MSSNITTQPMSEYLDSLTENASITGSAIVMSKEPAGLTTSTKKSIWGRLEEAPEDATQYARQDASWVEIAAGGAQHLSGTIGTTSTAGDFSSITNWDGVPGNYSAIIGLTTAKTNPYNANFTFYSSSLSEYIEEIPSEVKSISANQYKITMPITNDLIVDIL